MSEQTSKAALRNELRTKLVGISPAARVARSQAACALLVSTPEFQNAETIMLFLSMSDEVDTASLALRAWRMGKTVVVPKVSWNDRYMMPIEINCLTTNVTTSGRGIREPEGGQPFPIELINMVVVPGLGFTAKGHRIGRGMGFYDRFLAQPNFTGVSCGLCYEEQLVESLPVLDHDVPLGMLVTDRQIRRFANHLIGQ